MTYFLIIAALNAVLALWCGWAWLRAGGGRNVVLILAAWYIASLVIGSRDAFLQGWASAIGFLLAPVLIVSQVVILIALLVSIGSYRDRVARLPLSALILPHILRLPYGAVLLIMAAQGMLPGTFAGSAGVGDIVAALFAPVAAWSSQRPGRSGFVLVLFWNTYALLDLINVGRLAAQEIPNFANSGHVPIWIGPLPAFAVPLLIGLHLYLFYALWVRRSVAVHQPV